ncbi:MAG: NifU-like domain protein, partial [uncultured Acidimicrobiales bacterium]
GGHRGHPPRVAGRRGRHELRGRRRGHRPGRDRARRGVRQLPGVDDDAQGRHRAHPEGPRARCHRDRGRRHRRRPHGHRSL